MLRRTRAGVKRRGVRDPRSVSQPVGRMMELLQSRSQSHTEGKMKKTDVLKMLAAAALLGYAALGATPASAQNQHMEIIHHPTYDKTVFMPFVPAIKIKSGRLLWLAGT